MHLRHRLALATVLALAFAVAASIVILGGPEERSVTLTAAAADTNPTTAPSSAAPTTAPTTLEPTTTSAAPSTTAKPTTTTTTTKRPATTTTTVKRPPTTPTTATPRRVATTTAPPTTAAPVATGSDMTSAEAAFLACVRRRESGGNYSIVSANGLYYGAYQFLKSTWNSTASAAGRGDLVGVPPNQAAPADQDAMALFLYRRAGAAPWGGACR